MTSPFGYAFANAFSRQPVTVVNKSVPTMLDPKSSAGVVDSVTTEPKAAKPTTKKTRKGLPSWTDDLLLGAVKLKMATSASNRQYQNDKLSQLMNMLGSMNSFESNLPKSSIGGN